MHMSDEMVELVGEGLIDFGMVFDDENIIEDLITVCMLTWFNTETVVYVPGSQQYMKALRS